MSVKFSPFGNSQFFDENGDPAVGWKLKSYAAGSSTPLATYTDETGNTANDLEMEIDALGFVDNQVWITAGLSYKFVLTDENDVVKKTEDDITGVNDASISISQWIASGVTPTYVSSTSFTLVGDQTTDFHFGRRLQFTVSAGTVYATISASVFGALTTVTVEMDTSQALDVGLSAVNLSIMRADHSALPHTKTNTKGYSLTGPLNDDRATVASHATTADIWTVGNAIDWTGTATTTTFPAAPQAGARRRLHCAGACSFTHSATLDIVGNVSFLAAAGDIVEVEALTTSTFRLIPIKDDGTALVPVLRSYLAGLTMSTAGSSATMSIAAGQAQDVGNAVSMVLAASISKTTSAWAVGTGNGGLDTGAVANSTWYHFYLIRRPDTGVVDVLFSLNAISPPTLPTNYTQYRRIGSGKTNGSAQWTLFTQIGDEFLWDVALVDVDAQNPGTSAVTRTLTVPTGIAVNAILDAGGFYTSSAFTFALTPLSVSDQAPQAIATASLTGFSSNTSQNSVAGWNFAPINVRTNTSAQIRSRLSASGASDRLGIITRGWIDTRGRDV